MSSGTLPLERYHRTEAIGSGSFGSVLKVYNDDGAEYALKLFVKEEDSDDEGEDEGTTGIDVEALREISILRLLRESNGHRNVIQIHDVQTEFDEEDEVGAGTEGYLGIAMPLYPIGALSDNLAQLSTKKQKVVVAHGLLSAIAFLHKNSIIHRDIKADNVLLDEGNQPVLIDFSLAKMMNPTHNTGDKGGQPRIVQNQFHRDVTHTPDVGTPTYRAPEVVARESYGLAADMWSIGVILLEVLQGKCLRTDRDKSALGIIAEQLKQLPDKQPFPALIRGLLRTDPSKRWTAEEALNSEIFEKFGLSSSSVQEVTKSLLKLQEALPLDDGQDDFESNRENHSIQANATTTTKNIKAGDFTKLTDKKLVKRFKKIKSVCSRQGWDNPLTAQAAFSYSIQLSQLDDVDDFEGSQSLLDCVVLAHKMFETELANLHDLKQAGGAHNFSHWALEEYRDNESTILMMMDFCLYPRILVQE